MKSRRVFSTRSVSVRSRRTATAPPSGSGAAVTSKARPATMEVARDVRLFFLVVASDCGQKIGIPHRFDHGRVQAGALRNESIHRLVGPADDPVGANGDHGVLHAVEQSLELPLAGLNSSETTLNLLRGLVDCGGHAHQFRRAESRPLGRAVAFSMRAATSTMRSRRRDVHTEHATGNQQCYERSEQRSPNQMAAHLRLDCLTGRKVDRQA